MAPRGHEQHDAPQKGKAGSELRKRRSRRGGDSGGGGEKEVLGSGGGARRKAGSRWERVRRER